MMDSKSWMNLLKTQFVLGEKKRRATGLNMTHETIDPYYSSYGSIRPNLRLVAKVVLYNHYGPERVSIEGDANLVHAILEKLK